MKDELITNIAKKFNLEIKKTRDAYYATLPNCKNISCDIAIGRDALEWYITLIDTQIKKNIFKDWMDYLGYDKSPEEKLINIKYNDLLYFIENWLKATEIKTDYEKYFFKLLKRKICYWKINNKWQELTMCKIQNKKNSNRSN
ncbi:hypothetical protein J4226_05120 [Candidatus Pacearchaeota archaeon]|nr:hypothetical protein [Candidatus Pacearchaeota archaeon]